MADEVMTHDGFPRSWCGEHAPEVSTVGELIEYLKRLPADMRVATDWGDDCQISVTNHHDKDEKVYFGGMYFCLREIERDDDDDLDEGDE